MWGLFLMMMPLKKAHEAGRLNLAGKILGYPWLAIMILADFLWNAVVGTVVFRELPHEWLFTDRLDRKLSSPDDEDRRIAGDICKEFLDRYDPDGRHCVPK